ncbi:MAG: polyhydroxyalkanoate depolymerase, partial [Pseudomonadota bacterium]
QCLAALDLLTGLPESKKASHLEPGAGHYGIFAGKSWRNNIRPLVLEFIDQNARRKPVKSTEPPVAEAPAPVQDTPKKKPATKRKAANKNAAA